MIYSIDIGPHHTGIAIWDRGRINVKYCDLSKVETAMKAAYIFQFLPECETLILEKYVVRGSKTCNSAAAYIALWADLCSIAQYMNISLVNYTERSWRYTWAAAVLEAETESGSNWLHDLPKQVSNEHCRDAVEMLAAYFYNEGIIDKLIGGKK